MKAYVTEMRSLLLPIAALAAAPAALAEAHQVKSGTLVIVDPVVRASLGRVPNTAAYFVVKNNGRKADRLLGAACACAARADLHTTVQAGAVARMRPLAGVVVPAGGQTAFAPGGDHLMLTGVKRPIAPGAVVTLTLRFERAGLVTAPFRATARVEEALAGARRATHAH